LKKKGKGQKKKKTKIFRGVIGKKKSSSYLMFNLKGGEKGSQANTTRNRCLKGLRFERRKLRKKK